MKETPISPLHRQWGARMGAESGWQMPQQFHSLIEEHLAARSSCAVFDISHIAKISVTGNGALEWLESMLSNSIARCQDGCAQRTLMLDEDGGIMDKMTLLRESAGRFFLLGHAAMAEEDFSWLDQHKPTAPLEVADETMLWSAMSLTGPDSELVLNRSLPEVELPNPMTFRRIVFQDDDLLLARVGLQGDEGFQIFCPANRGIRWFETLVRSGAVPCGSATQENLRMVQGSCCCYRDIRGNSPQYASLEYLCDRDKTYIGSAGVAKAALNPPEMKLVSLRCPEDGDLPEPGSSVMDDDDHVVGHITTACVPPESGCSLAFAAVMTRFATPGARLDILLSRGRIPTIVIGPPNA